jgi:hypothetical protein
MTYLAQIPSVLGFGLSLMDSRSSLEKISVSRSPLQRKGIEMPGSVSLSSRRGQRRRHVALKERFGTREPAGATVKGQPLPQIPFLVVIAALALGRPRRTSTSVAGTTAYRAGDAPCVSVGADPVAPGCDDSSSVVAISSNAISLCDTFRP